MPLSHCLRPISVLTCAYIFVLAMLGAGGAFRVGIPPAWKYYAFVPSLRVEGTLLSGFSPKRPGERFWVRLDRVDDRPLPPIKVMAYVSRKDPDTLELRPGQRVGFNGRLRLPLWPRNPGGFDERTFLDLHGAALVLHVQEVAILEEETSLFFLPWAVGEVIHRSMHAYFQRRFSGVEASILEGLILGYRGALPSGLSRSFQDAGVMHMLTPSGAKVTLVLACVLGLTSWAGLPPAVRFSSAVLGGGLYLLVVGPHPPYTRAYGMALAAYASWVWGRGSGPFAGFILSALAILLVDPRTLFSAGFLLTYLAMLGLLVALPRWSAFLPPGTTVLGISLIVQLMLWPTFAAFFGRGSLVGVAVNALLVPGSALVTAAGAAAWAADLAGMTFLEVAAASAAAALVRLFVDICVRAAALPYAAVDLRPMSGPLIAAYYLGVFGFLLLPRWSLSLRFWLMALCVGIPAGASRGPKVLRAVVFAPPGARGMFLEHPDGRRVLLDGGIRPSVMGELKRELSLGRASQDNASGTRKFGYRGVGIEWEEGGVAVTSGGKVQYCIITSSTAARKCPYAGTFTPRWDGAVRVAYDGKRIKIETQKERHSIGRPLL